MPTRPPLSLLPDLPRICASLAALLVLVAPGMAGAQESGVGAHGAAGGEPAFVATPSLGLGSIASLDVSVGPDRRPRRSLRFRFESATRAMRTLGVEADDCTTVLRSSNRGSGARGDPRRLDLTVALNCRFF